MSTTCLSNDQWLAKVQDIVDRREATLAELSEAHGLTRGQLRSRLCRYRERLQRGQVIPPPAPLPREERCTRPIDVADTAPITGPPLAGNGPLEPRDKSVETCNCETCPPGACSAPEQNAQPGYAYRNVVPTPAGQTYPSEGQPSPERAQSDDTKRRLSSVSVDKTYQDPNKNPDLHVPTAPLGFHLRGVSTLQNAAGETVSRWVKTAKDREARHLEDLLDALARLPEPFRGAANPVRPPRDTRSDLLCVYPIADPHIGMYAWARETGNSYDLKTAERVHVEAVDALVAVAPSATLAIVASLGDWFHSDNPFNRTARAGNALDVDTRFPRVLEVGLRTMRRCIDQALKKHDRVRVISCIGNHDDATSIMLALAMGLYYERDERVSVDTSPDPFHWERFGKCLLGFAHGDEAKPEQLPGIMATDRREDWGATEYRQWYTGHRHKLEIQEFPGAIVSTERSLVARDAWSHRAGYRSRRSMRCDVWHRTRGDINSHRVGIEELEQGT